MLLLLLLLLLLSRQVGHLDWFIMVSNWVYECYCIKMIFVTLRMAMAKVNNGSVDLWTVEQIERSQKTDVANILSVPRGFYHIQRNKY